MVKSILKELQINGTAKMEDSKYFRLLRLTRYKLTLAFSGIFFPEYGMPMS